MLMEEVKFSIDKEAVAEMDAETFPGRITVINSARDAKKALRYLMTQAVVGIDTETRPNFRKGVRHNVSLVQISTADHAFLFRVKFFGIIDEMVELFEDEKVTKVGLSLRDDFNQLQRLREFAGLGFVDLQDMVGEYDIVDASLQKVYAIVFGKRITKTQQLSNWEAEELTEAQRSYGAIDAWACLRLYNTLKSGGFDAANCPYIKAPEPEIEEDENEEN